MAKIRIKTTPQHSGKQTPPGSGGTAHPIAGSFYNGSTPEIKVNQTLQPTSREHATLEAEKGETVVTNLQGEGIPEFYKIAGKSHAKGGTPLNLPPNSFIYSKDKNLAIKDPEVLSMFGRKMKKGTKKGFTPADVSMAFNLNKYREILVNPSTDKLQRETAEKMIQNYNLKLGQLALVQESMKGFKGDIPAIAMGYLEHIGIAPEELVNPGGAPNQAQMAQQVARMGLETFKGGGSLGKKRRVRVNGMPQFAVGGDIDFNEVTGKYGENALADLNTYMDTTMTQGRDWKGIAGQAAGPVMDKLASIGRNRTEPNVNFEDMTSADQVFSSNQRPDYGTNMFNTQGVVDPYRVKEAAQFDGQSAGIARFGGNMPEYEQGGGIPMFQNAGEVKTSSKPTAKQNIPKEGIFWDPEAEGYNESDVQEGHYIKKNGRWHKVTGYQKKTYDGPVDERVGTYGTDLGLLEQNLQDPAIRTAIYDQYMTELKKTKPGKNLRQGDIDAALAMSEDEVIDNFIKKQAINLAIVNKYGDLSEYDKKDLWDSNPNLANETAVELGFDALTKSEVASFQGTYIAINDLSTDGEHNEMFKDFRLAQLGLRDEQVSGEFEQSISQVDGWDGNTTSGEVIIPRNSELAYEELEDLEPEKEVTPDKTKHLTAQPPADPAKFWTEDLNNIGFAASELFNIDKAKPWQAPLQYKEAQPAVQDFRGAAARIGSATNAGAQQAGTLMGPQSFGATFANMQSGAVDPILKTQEAERRGNQDIINKFETFNTQQFNQHAGQKAALDTALYDKHIIANQQFKNAKTQARDKVRGLLNNAWTNRGKTQNLNLMTDQYDIDPVTGYKHYNGVRKEVDPQATQGNAIYKSFLTIKDENPEMDDASAIKLAKGINGVQDYPQGVNPAAYNMPQQPQ